MIIFVVWLLKLKCQNHRQTTESRKLAMRREMKGEFGIDSPVP